MEQRSNRREWTESEIRMTATQEASLEDRLVEYIKQGEDSSRELPELAVGAADQLRVSPTEIEDALYSALDGGRVRFSKLGSAISIVEEWSRAR
ncbi:hypothetical protein GCM10009788_11190 [Nocardioides humi]|uniref:Uncharacterized protein n=1 Tax=Nocardioides humi TaxID=449461 RepID=A0ABN2A0C5_9ACTN